MTCRSQNFRTIMKRIILQTFFALFLIQLGAYAQTTSWKGTSNTDWNRAANWTAGVPTASVDAIIGDANFTGANQPDLSASSVCKSLTIGTGSIVSTLKADKSLTVSGNVTIGAGSAITLNANISVAGILTVNGTFDATTLTVSGGGKLTVNSGGNVVV